MIPGAQVSHASPRKLLGAPAELRSWLSDMFTDAARALVGSIPSIGIDDGGGRC